VTIRHYHADNGIFAAKEFISALEADGGQTISYCGVNAHHQNGHAEKKIRDLQDLARTMILHAQQRWPSAITANLWPYAIRMANDVSNIRERNNEGGVINAVILRIFSPKNPLSVTSKCLNHIFV
jgi:hypothetical protein